MYYYIDVGRFLTMLVFLLSFASVSLAAQRTFGPFMIDDSRPEVIALNGEIDVGSALDFRRVLQAAPNAKLLVLNSPGGAVAIGLLIADDVYHRDLATFIPKNSSCYSACAYVFLAGKVRQVEGELGVHQISSESNDLVSAQYSISDVIDVLNRFGTPTEVLTVMFRTPPKDMHIFTQEEIVRFQINRKQSDPQPTVASNSGPASADTNPATDESSHGTKASTSSSASNTQALSKLSIIEGYARRPTRMAVYAGLDLFGADIASIRTSDTAECAKNCLSMNGQCKAFTFNANSRLERGPNCFLKANEGVADGNAVAVSGKLLSSADPDPQQFSMGTIDPKLSVFKDVDLPGGDLSSRPAAKGGTAQQCRLACIAESRCTAFTYIKAKGECWLKGAAGIPSYRQGMITGVKKFQTFAPASIISLE